MFNKTSDSIKLFSDKVLPLETKSTIVEQISSFGASSIAPFNFTHSALIPFFAKKLTTVFLYLVATVICPVLG